MKQQFTVKSLMTGKEFNIIYEYEDKMVNVDIVDDGIIVGNNVENRIRERIEVEYKGKMYKGSICKIASFETGKAVEICKKCNTDIYIRVNIDGIYLLIPINEEDMAKFELIRKKATTPEVSEYKKAEEEKISAARISTAEVIIKKSEKTIRNKDGSLMNEEQANLYKKWWNDTYNEGGEGYIPEIITVEQVEWANKILNKE